MNQKRMLLFLIGCMGARSALTYGIKNYSEDYKKILTILLLVPAIGFSYIYLNDLRKTGPEVFGDKIWWNNLRPFHALMYFAGSLLVYIGNKDAYLPIAIDTLVGLIAFLSHHFYSPVTA